METNALEGERGRYRLTHRPGDAGGAKELLADGDRVHPVRQLAPNGLEAWAQVVQERGYEEYVGKDEASQ